MSHLDQWEDARSIKVQLHDDGWFSPDTYCNFFRPVPEEAGVYLFLLHSDEFTKGLIAYVGMSENVKQRWTGHEVLRELNASPCWPMRWFKPTALSNIREVEQTYIVQFNPPWNIQGKRRGVPLS